METLWSIRATVNGASPQHPRKKLWGIPSKSTTQTEPGNTSGEEFRCKFQRSLYSTNGFFPLADLSSMKTHSCARGFYPPHFFQVCSWGGAQKHFPLTSPPWPSPILKLATYVSILWLENALGYAWKELWRKTLCGDVREISHPTRKLIWYFLVKAGVMLMLPDYRFNFQLCPLYPRTDAIIMVCQGKCRGVEDVEQDWVGRTKALGILLTCPRILVISSLFKDLATFSLFSLICQKLRYFSLTNKQIPNIKTGRICGKALNKCWLQRQ